MALTRPLQLLPQALQTLLQPQPRSQQLQWEERHCPAQQPVGQQRQVLPNSRCPMLLFPALCTLLQPAAALMPTAPTTMLLVAVVLLLGITPSLQRQLGHGRVGG